MHSVSELLAELALQCGIDIIGIVDNSKLKTFSERIKIPNTQKIPFFNGSIYDRLKPENAWSKALSVISLGISYNSSVKYNTMTDERGIISKASYGEDYHTVLKRKAECLMQEFVKVYPCEYRVYVDTGKLSDKALAYCAGLGFFGKNGLIINEEFGSFIFLGHILLNIDISTQAYTKTSKCGACTKCIDVCPQNAYDKNCRYSYGKCISYLNQCAMPYNKTRYIYGCDICQDICPFNAEAPHDMHEEFSYKKDDVFPLLSDILDMEDDTFKLKYGQTSLAWRGLDALKKNCLNIQKRDLNGGENV